jgi:hypothetical protein
LAEPFCKVLGTRSARTCKSEYFNRPESPQKTAYYPLFHGRIASIARERHPAAEIVLISGTRPDPGQRPLGRRERFLRKPIPPADLAAAIRSAAAAASARAAA